MMTLLSFSRNHFSTPLTQAHSHGVSVSDVFAGGLDDGLTGLVQSAVDAIVGPGVCFLNQRLDLMGHGQL